MIILFMKLYKLLSNYSLALHGLTETESFFIFFANNIYVHLKNVPHTSGTG